MLEHVYQTLFGLKIVLEICSLGVEGGSLYVRVVLQSLGINNYENPLIIISVII